MARSQGHPLNALSSTGVMRTVSFHGSPLTKFIIVLFSIFTALGIVTILLAEENNPLFELVKLVSVPLGSRWLICATVFYQTHQLEKRLGSHNYLNILLSSTLVSWILLASTLLSIHSIPLHPGTLIYILFGCLVTMTILQSRASHTRTLLGIRFSSHTITLAASVLLLLNSHGAFLPLLLGTLGALTVHWTGPLPLPHSLLSLLVAVVTRACKEDPPKLLTGATLSIQRQQRMDLLEGYLLNFQQTRVQQERRRGPYIPTESQIQQLNQMGFRPEQSQHALVTANGNIAHAIQLLTTNRPD